RGFAARGCGPARKSAPQGIYTQRVGPTNDSDRSHIAVSPENSPKGIHKLAQGQRATASATLGYGHPPAVPRRGYIRIHSGQPFTRSVPASTSAPPVVSLRGLRLTASCGAA